MLIKIEHQIPDTTGVSYAPPTATCLINTDYIVGVEPTDTPRGSGPWVIITMVNGTQKIARGTPESLWEKCRADA